MRLASRQQFQRLPGEKAPFGFAGACCSACEHLFGLLNLSCATARRHPGRAEIAPCTVHRCSLFSRFVIPGRPQGRTRNPDRRVSAGFRVRALRPRPGMTNRLCVNAMKDQSIGQVQKAGILTIGGVENAGEGEGSVMKVGGGVPEYIPPIQCGRCAPKPRPETSAIRVLFLSFGAWIRR